MKNSTLFTATLMTATLSAVAVAHADDAQTTVVSATNTVVVVTPNQPVVVGGNAAPAPVVGNGPGTVAPVAGLARPTIVDADISQINGQLVPVGTHNDYHYSFRKTLIAVNPIGWLVGVYGVSVSHAVSNNVAIRGDVTAYINPLDSSSSTGIEFGVSAPIYLRRTYQGPFIEPGVVVRTITSDYCYDSYSTSGTDSCSSTETQVGPQVLAGYQVSYDSGFSMAAAFGLQRNLSTNSEYGDDILPAGYFRIGYAF